MTWAERSWQAARNGQIAAARLLAEHGADVNRRAPWSDETPLDMARAKGHDEVAGAGCSITEAGTTGEHIGSPPGPCRRRPGMRQCA